MEAAVVCSLSILIISSFLFLFIVLRKEFELKQNMYQALQYKMLLENDTENKEDVVSSFTISLLGLNKKIVISNLLKNYGFDGYDVGEALEDVYVYVTTNGTVYHRDKDCIHLTIAIQECRLEEIPELRNLDGAKYYPCELCGTGYTDAKCYITPYGDRYHSTKECSALKRIIRTVLLEDVKDMEECEDCGNG